MDKQKRRTQSIFYETDRGEIRYNDTCLNCLKSCRQSYRVTLVQCPLYDPRNKRNRR